MAENSKKKIPFWTSKPLNELSEDEWESLCDGCGKCCLQKLQDDETDEVHFTCISCKYLDANTCQCKVYNKRFDYLPECLDLTYETLVNSLDWLPNSCAYKLVYQGKPLPKWHHLRSGRKNTIHKYGASVKGKVLNEKDVDQDDWEDFIVEIN